MEFLNGRWGPRAPLRPSSQHFCSGSWVFTSAKGKTTPLIHISPASSKKLRHRNQIERITSSSLRRLRIISMLSLEQSRHEEKGSYHGTGENSMMKLNSRPSPIDCKIRRMLWSNKLTAWFVQQHFCTPYKTEEMNEKLKQSIPSF